MKQITLGRSGIKTVQNAFGALPIQRISKEQAALLLQKAYRAGITFFDTARAYSDSEEKIGYALHDVRAEITIATKTMATDADGFFADLEKSLCMLRTDYMMIMGITIFLAVMIIVMNFLADVLYKVMDPRINLS